MDDVGALVAITLITLACVGLGVRAAHQVTATTPARIVQRLLRTNQPVVIKISAFSSLAWDPANDNRFAAFHRPGIATYTLDDPKTIHIKFVPDSGQTVEHSALIPSVLLPEPPEARRRRWIARAAFTLYMAAAIVAFSLTAVFTSGTGSFRASAGGAVALGSVSIAWSVTHFFLTRHRQASQGTPKPAHSRHFAVGLLAYVLVSSAFAVAWQLGSHDEPHPTSWASAFLSAAIFVAAVTAALTASLHHHTYIHHSEQG